MNGAESAGRCVRPVLLVLAAACVAATTWAHRPGVPTSLRIRVTPPASSAAAFTVEIVHAGIATNLALPDDGRGVDPVAGDGIRSAEWSPPGPAVLVPVHLWMRPSPGAPAVRIHSAIHPVVRGPNELAWEVSGGPVPEVHSHAHPGPRRSVAAAEGRRMAWNAGFAIVALLVVLRLARGTAGGPITSDSPDAPAGRVPRGAADALFWLAMAVLWTWPAALGGPAAWIGRHFDTPSTIWVMDAAPRLLRSLVDTQAEWPLHADHHGLDSFLMLPIAALLHGLHAARVHAWLQILGVALSGWAAQGFARATEIGRAHV